MRFSDVFIPIKGLLIIGWFLILCILAPILALTVLLVGTCYVFFEARGSRNRSRGTSDEFSSSKKRPEYPG